jgi:hypothetical protein
MSVLLLNCPLCGRGRFTPRGLRAHWCSAKPAGAKHSAPLTKEEWQSAVDRAIAAHKRKAKIANRKS